ncbi:protein FRA10AC1 homolog [Sitodiplosis mosellana]|uniref:protein FRA10AC1 homolog n=1 Tax=Sitodiplosis mosellana TaxID=263140 RepID=UPI0024437FFF|nr:protein FRA10AC1 homolog [Sitodiplosis mosellana]
MSYFKDLNPYQLHQKLINEYILRRPGDTSKLYVRDTSKDKTDLDVIRENHQFLWNENEADSWDKQLAKKYYDKLFKEYCIADLTKYKENKIALRWRIDREVISGKGQFICGNKKCEERSGLRSWEVNFAYVEHGEKKNALIKLRLCPICSDKLNYHSKKREVKRMKKQTKHNSHRHNDVAASSVSPQATTSYDSTERGNKTNISQHTDAIPNSKASDAAHQQLEQIFWSKSTDDVEKTREEEFDDYLADLLL